MYHSREYCQIRHTHLYYLSRGSIETCVFLDGVGMMRTKVSILTEKRFSKLENIGSIVVSVDGKSVINMRSCREFGDTSAKDLPFRLKAHKRDFSESSGFSGYPLGSSFIIKNSDLQEQSVIATVIPSSFRGYERDKQIRILYEAYIGCLKNSVSLGRKKVALPLLGIESRNCEVECIIVAIISAIMDFTTHTNSLEEICIVVKDRKERRLILGWLSRVANTFGLKSIWYRKSTDFADERLELRLC